MSKRKPVQYRRGAAINTNLPLDVSRLARPNWTAVLTAYPELRPAVGLLVNKVNVVIDAPRYHEAADLMMLRAASYRGMTQYRDRRIFERRFGEQVVGVAEVIFGQDGQNKVTVCINRLAGQRNSH